MILAGDVGGTKTVVGLFDDADARLRLVSDATVASRDHDGLDGIVREFLARNAGTGPPPRAACFGVAGPVLDGRCVTTNLPWHLDEQALARALGIARVRLVNDITAAAFGMLHLGPEELATLNAGDDPARRGTLAIIAAGTGLGEGILHWDGVRYHALASEGGHADFAPRTDEQVELFRYLRAYHEHVSYEQVLSGPGLRKVHDFLRDRAGVPAPDWLASRLVVGDPSVAIVEAGLAARDPVCTATLALFADIYGAEAGNLALKCLALGGVFVAGGIAPRILPVLEGGGFMRCFTEKGRFAPLLSGVPVHVARNPRAPLLGAAHLAAGEHGAG